VFIGLRRNVNLKAPALQEFPRTARNTVRASYRGFRAFNAELAGECCTSFRGQTLFETSARNLDTFYLPGSYGNRDAEVFPPMLEHVDQVHDNLILPDDGSCSAQSSWS